MSALSEVVAQLSAVEVEIEEIFDQYQNELNDADGTGAEAVLAIVGKLEAVRAASRSVSDAIDDLRGVES